MLDIEFFDFKPFKYRILILNISDYLRILKLNFEFFATNAAAAAASASTSFFLFNFYYISIGLTRLTVQLGAQTRASGVKAKDTPEQFVASFILKKNPFFLDFKLDAALVSAGRLFQQRHDKATVNVHYKMLVYYALTVRYPGAGGSSYKPSSAVAVPLPLLLWSPQRQVGQQKAAALNRKCAPS